MNAWTVAAIVAVMLAANGALAQGTDAAKSPPSPRTIALVDSTGKAAAKPLSETIMLVTLSSGDTAPALIRPIYGPDGRTASGLATWQSGGGVLFTSSGCTGDAFVYSSTLAGVRAAAQVQTPGGIMLYVGAVGATTTAKVQSILYDTGCAQVTVEQNGLVPVVATVNLTSTYPPPLSLQ
jgi:hypothetical protein